MVTDVVSAMLLVTNHNALHCFHVDSPLTKVACKVISKLPDLRGLSMVVEKNTLLSPVVLPNLTDLVIQCDQDSDWSQMFHGATLGKLKAVTLYSESYQAYDFLEEFERVTPATSTRNTLSKFQLYTSYSWNPNYPSLLPFM